MARKPTKAAEPAKPFSELLEKYKDFPGIAVLERRLENPDLPGSLPIRLKDEPTHAQDPHGKKRIWYLRWVDTGENGRYSMVTDVHGYVPVRVEELQSAVSTIGAADTKDGIVRRGDKGREVLCKIPLELYNAIKSEQQRVRERRSRNARAVKHDIASAAGVALGDEAGQTISDEFSLEVKHGRGTLGGELSGHADDLEELHEA
jgi:hypothetical protein